MIKIFYMSAPFSIVLLSLGILSCSTTKYKLPVNYVDEPPILPNKMYESKIIYNKDIYGGNNEYEDTSPTALEQSIAVLSGLLYVRKSINHNLEMPVFPIPVNISYLFGENDFKNHNRIEYNKFYHLINFGVTSLSYSSRDGLEYGLGVNYINTYAGKGVFKNEITTGLNYRQGYINNLNDIEFVTANLFSYKLHRYVAPFVRMAGSYRHISHEFYAPAIISDESRFRESMGVGMKIYLTSFARVTANYSLYLEQYNSYYTSGFKNREGINSFWNILAAFYW